jgi:hypothetical protein
MGTRNQTARKIKTGQTKHHTKATMGLQDIPKAIMGHQNIPKNSSVTSARRKGT